MPQQYYYQIQGQLDVCGLDECDYLECEFEVTEDPDWFWATYDDFSIGERGCALELATVTAAESVSSHPATYSSKYEYSGLDLPKDECSIQSDMVMLGLRLNPYQFHGLSGCACTISMGNELLLEQQ